MNKRSLFGLSAALAAGITATTACAPALPPDAVYVRLAPPAAQVEVIGTAPGPNYLWINGYQRWDGSAYVWNSGRWEQRPHPNARWEQGRWVHTNRGWYYQDGRWR